MIALENIVKEIDEIKEQPMSWDTVEKYVLLKKAEKYLCEGDYGELTEAQAKEWVKAMKPIGEHWTYEQTTALLKQRGYCFSAAEWYAVMNSLYSDYGATLAKYGADKPEVWIDLARDWLVDEDAAPGKAERYYEVIAGKK